MHRSRQASQLQKRNSILVNVQRVNADNYNWVGVDYNWFTFHCNSDHNRTSLLTEYCMIEANSRECYQ